MNKPLSEWTMDDVLAFFEKHELTPQQIVPVFGSGAVTMVTMANDHNDNEMKEYYRNIASELTLITIQDLCRKMA